MSIREVREYAAMVRRGESSLKQRQELLRAHRVRVAARMRDLADALTLIDDKIEFYGTWLGTGVQPKLPVARKKRS